ncbi:hypothetical protein [uncultured Ornithinimicrobium sp.]|uniref:hypothetical protein n=1 Tax=uncultured Ornithinimicrobium sp. TaxID=259307 RepID=UPI0025934F89|nr:hypothetical protein [uncultured Ornithinimicrobium sp.]
MDVPADPDEALAHAVQALFAVPAAEFVATRTALAKELRGARHRDAAKELTGMRKPSVSAAAVNALVRAEDPVVDRLVELGGAMRQATSALDGRALAALRTDRDELLRDWVRAAAEHAGGSLTPSVEAEVRDTAVAALADADATQVVTSGSLTRALSYSGFGEVDLADAVARTSTGVVLTRIEGGRGDGEVGEDEAAELEEEELEGNGDEDDAVPEEEEADSEEDELQGEDEPDDEEDDELEDDEDDEDDDHLDVDDLEMELDEAEKVVAAARAERRRRVRAETDAADRVEEAAAEVSRAEDVLRSAQEQLSTAQRTLDEAQTLLTAAQDERTGAEEALRAARERRDEARVALEEAEDA